MQQFWEVYANSNSFFFFSSFSCHEGLKLEVGHILKKEASNIYSSYQDEISFWV